MSRLKMIFKPGYDLSLIFGFKLLISKMRLYRGRQSMDINCRRYVLTAMLLLAFATEMQAQRRLMQLSGVIIDGQYSYPLPYATVEILNSYRGAAANSQGFFPSWLPSAIHCDSVRLDTSHACTSYRIPSQI